MLRSYHQFLGNRIDAVLLGPSGGMSAEPAQGLDRCYWYKADLYYADSRTFIPGDDAQAFVAAPPTGTNFQLAPLGRAWYELPDNEHGSRTIDAATQQFSVEEATLITRARFAGLPVEVRTFLADQLPILVFEITAPEPTTIVARSAPGLWEEDQEQTNPVVEQADGPPAGCRFRVAEHWCTLRLLVDASTEVEAQGNDHRGAWVRLNGRRIRWGAALTTDRYAEEAAVSALDYLPPNLLPAYKTPAQLFIPDADFQRLHQFSLYMFRAMQHRHSGGLPVNNLRRTFNSHVFWDGAFVQRVLLETGYVEPAREAWRFLARTREAAAANARDTFQAPGLHWDWETTHRGERAYLPWLQQRYQVHNTPLLAHMVMEDFLTTDDRHALSEGYELLAGAAEFVLHAVLEEREGVLSTRPLVGSHESATPVVNDGATVAACLRLLQDTASAAHILDRPSALSRRCEDAARRLQPSLDALFNGRYFQASRNEDRLNTSSLAPIYPAGTIMPSDPRARATAQAYRALYPGRLVGHGNGPLGFPWSAGILARILAYQDRAAEAWEQLDFARPALCAQGGCAEYCDEHGRWNAQYFSTAQAALCSGLDALVLQTHGSEIHLFPALPPGWTTCAFKNFQALGLRITATLENGTAAIEISNPMARERRAMVKLGNDRRAVTVPAGGRQHMVLENRDD
jgi:hypothetical protein